MRCVKYSVSLGRFKGIRFYQKHGGGSGDNTLNAPVLNRSRKLSKIVFGWYLDG